MSEHHEAIRNLMGRYCELVDSGDWATLADLLGDCALVDESGRAFATGRDEIRANWERQTKLYDGSPRTRHLTVNPVIEVDEAAGAAHATSAYVVFQQTDALPMQPIIAGHYADTFRLDDGTWRFTERRYAVTLVGELSQHLATNLPT